VKLRNVWQWIAVTGVLGCASSGEDPGASREPAVNTDVAGAAGGASQAAPADATAPRQLLLATTSCPSFSATNDQHVQAGRATKSSFPFFIFVMISYDAVGSQDYLGASGSTKTTLYPAPGGGYTLTSQPCGGSGSGGSNGSGGMTGSGGVTGSGGMTGSSGTTSIPPVTCAAPTAPDTCGNGKIDPGELCDGANLRGMSCTTLDPFYTGGTLACATNCRFDPNKCLHAKCGNGIVDSGEDCESQTFYLQQTSCSSVLAGSAADGALVECDATCHYNFRNCQNAPAAVCGNGKVEGQEQCDGLASGPRDCTGWGPYLFTGGLLGCSSSCKLDFAQCTRCDAGRCGDGVVGAGEECDGTNIGSHTCFEYSRFFGTPSCNGLCQLDASTCFGGCSYLKGRLLCN
jgi:hypothetical protein